ncbi:hypothetical protein [Candidatus Thiothrix anitrata]|uniref:Uncharacterized protein n=1 Tax=Candidatus Thiothrix anitrata TaxID=2823902 RepID=A0ABX7X1N7_9GAMM|nr:hypothetical protein [Candidatus Thiothrix anitrata]QTR49856.1 hypothetical protein J8380_16790 [Candidatus Thiothrix anitrata]
MEKIAIIRDKSELDSTAYVEIISGKYQGKHWQNGSLFFDEETFGYIEPIFRRNISGYDHYNMNDGSKTEWLKIILELQELNDILSASTNFSDCLDSIGFIFKSTKVQFQENHIEAKEQLIKLNNELITWAKEELKTHEHIAILGL